MSDGAGASSAAAPARAGSDAAGLEEKGLEEELALVAWRVGPALKQATAKSEEWLASLQGWLKETPLAALQLGDDEAPPPGAAQAEGRLDAVEVARLRCGLSQERSRRLARLLRLPPPLLLLFTSTLQLHAPLRASYG